MLLKNCESLSGFVSLQGEVLTRVVFLSEEDKFECFYVSEPFKEELEVDGCDKDDVVEAYAFIKDEKVTTQIENDDKGQKLTINIPVEVLLRVYHNELISIVDDIYGTKNEINLTTESFENSTICPLIVVEDKIEGSLNLSKCVIGKLSIGWVSNTLNMSGAEIKKIETPIDANSVIMSNAKIGKLPEHIWTDSLNMEKSSIEKLNTDIRANVFNIRGTKISSLPKNLRVHKLITDSKSAKNLSLMTLKQCDELILDESIYFEQRDLVENYNFSNVVSSNEIEMVCSM